MDKILLVDDDENFLGLMKNYLRKSFDIDTAETAMEALERMKHNKYVAVILDVSLPDYTGYFLGKLIRKDFPSIPLAFLTNYNGEVTVENAEEVNAQYWRKTSIVLEPKALETKIRNLYML